MKHAFKILTRSVAGILLGALLLFASLIVKDCSYAHSLPSQYPARLGTSVDTMGGLWFFEMYTNDVGYVRTVFTLSASDGKFEGHSREDVSPKLLGWWKNFLGKLFTSDFENGALLHLKRGSYKLTAAGETEFTAEFISAFGEYDVKGKISEGRMRASLHHRGKVVGSIYGSRNIPALPLANYPALTETIIQTAEANLYSDKIARTKDWESFKAEMRNFSHIATDDIEYMFAFFYRSRSLPFTHFNLFQKRTDSMLVLDSGSAIEKLIYTKDLSDSVSYLRVSSFAGNSEEVDRIFDTIIVRNRRYLMIDLRGNPGGNISAMRVISHLIDTPSWGGAFVTRRWFATHAAPPSVAEYRGFPLLEEANLDLLFKGIHNYDGLCLKANPDVKKYKGRVIVLVDRNTASSCEPLVYGIKEYKLGKIVGERTAGAMLNGEEFAVKDYWAVTIPTAEYYTADGFRIDKAGVEPDLSVSSTNAIREALDNLGK